MGIEQIDFSKLDAEQWEQIFKEGFRWVRERNGGYLPLQAYLAKTITFPTSYVDVAPIYRGEGGDDILLVKRADTEAIFPGHWHVAGGATLARQTIEEKRRFLLLRECGGDMLVEFHFAGVVYMPTTDLEIADVKLFLAITEGGWLPPAKAAWFSLDDLPSPLVPSQMAAYIPLIRRVLAGGSPEFVEYLGK